MTLKRRALGVIIARGGSKGVPRKNVLPLCGKPLIAYAIEAARESKLLTRCIVSTDDEEIADVARQYRGDVPFLRPSNLARANSGAFDVLQHSVIQIERQEGRNYDDIVLLQPTSPLREGVDIDNALRLFRAGEAESLITVYRHDQIHPFIMYTIDSDGLARPIAAPKDRMLQRQELPPVYIRTGVVYAFRRDLLFTGQDIYGQSTVAYIVPQHKAVCIDTKLDFLLCEFLMGRR